MKKSLALTILAIVASFLFNKHVLAATYSFTPTDDLDVRQYYNASFNTNTLVAGTPFYSAGVVASSIPYLKFDISSLSANQTVSSIKLTMPVYSQNWTYMVGARGDANLFYVSDNNWSEGVFYDYNTGALQAAMAAGASSSFRWDNRPQYSGSDFLASGTFESAGLNDTVTWEFLPDARIFSQSELSFAIEQEVLPTDYSNQYFIAYNSKEINNGAYMPILEIEANPAPVPEPSSLVLGLLGLAGAAFSKRKNK